MSPRNQFVSLVESQRHVINSANPGGALDDGIEYRLHIRGRSADDAEHLGRCRLVLQCLAQFRVALAKFLEQPYVFNRDHGLIGEGLQKSDLSFRERTDLRSANLNGSDRGPFSEQGRNAERVRVPVTCWRSLGFRELGISTGSRS